MEVLLGGISSLLYGVGDFLGGEGAKRAPASSVVLWSGVMSFPLISLLALAVGGEARISDFVYGGLAGTCGVLGLVALFAGLSRGQAAVVAPVSASMTAILPVLVGILEGDRQSARAWVGVAIAFPAIALCSWIADASALRAAGILYGLVAGLGFGGFTVIIRLTRPESSLLPLIASRGATVAVIIGLSTLGIWRISGLSRMPRLIVAANALFDVTANVTLLLALRAGSLALAAVSASFYPAVTVLMARVVNSEMLRGRQVTGLALTLMSLGLIALG